MFDRGERGGEAARPIAAAIGKLEAAIDLIDQIIVGDETHGDIDVLFDARRELQTAIALARRMPRPN
jgi:hypothetical protein